MRLIDADKLQELYAGVDENLEMTVRVVRANIDDMPTAGFQPEKHRCIYRLGNLCEKHSDPAAKIVSYCYFDTNCKDQKLSNADRIREMSDMELAMFYSRKIAACYGCESETMDDCVDCWIDWLKQEAEDE